MASDLTASERKLLAGFGLKPVPRRLRGRTDLITYKTGNRTRIRRLTRYGIRYVILDARTLPPRLGFLAGGPGDPPWIPLCAARDGRLLRTVRGGPAGFRTATPELARVECEIDAAFLRNSEAEHWNLTGRPPSPLRAPDGVIILEDGRMQPVSPVITWHGWWRRWAGRPARRRRTRLIRGNAPALEQGVVRHSWRSEESSG